jgi:hypothetical protein
VIFYTWSLHTPLSIGDRAIVTFVSLHILVFRGQLRDIWWIMMWSVNGGQISCIVDFLSTLVINWGTPINALTFGRSLSESFNWFASEPERMLVAACVKLGTWYQILQCSHRFWTLSSALHSLPTSTKILPLLPLQTVSEPFDSRISISRNSEGRWLVFCFYQRKLAKI